MKNITDEIIKMNSGKKEFSATKPSISSTLNSINVGIYVVLGLIVISFVSEYFSCYSVRGMCGIPQFLFIGFILAPFFVILSIISLILYSKNKQKTKLQIMTSRVSYFFLIIVILITAVIVLGNLYQ